MSHLVAKKRPLLPVGPCPKGQIRPKFWSELLKSKVTPVKTLLDNVNFVLSVIGVVQATSHVTVTWCHFGFESFPC